MRVRGDDEHPVSRGYTCSKGRGLRGLAPLARPARPAAGARPRRVVGRVARATSRDGSTRSSTSDGPDAVALYLATGLAYDAAGQIAASQWLPSIGSRSFLTAVTVDNAPVLVAAELVSGEPMLNPVWDPTVPGLTIFVGTNPVVSHGYGTALARSGAPRPRLPRAPAAGCGCSTRAAPRPRRSPTCTFRCGPAPTSRCSARSANALLEDGADEHELREHCDPTEVARIAHRRSPRSRSNGPRSRPTSTARCSSSSSPTCAPRPAGSRCSAAPASRWRATASSPSGCAGSCSSRRARSTARAACTSTGGSSARCAGATRRDRLAPRRRRRRAGPSFHACVGQIPAVALADEIEAGNIRALFVTGGNPLTAFPQPARLRAALATLDVLAVVDVAENPLTELATHVLPATGQLERADITLAELTALEARAAGDATRRRARSPSAGRSGGCSPALNRAMGRATPGGRPRPAPTSDTCAACCATRRSTPTTCSRPGRTASTRRSSTAGCTTSCWPTAAGASRRRPLLERLAAYVDPEPAAVRARATARDGVEQLDRLRRGAGRSRRSHAPGRRRDGCRRRSRPATAASRPRIAADPTVRAGVVSITHGHLDENPGDLTSGDIDVDPLTAMPRVAGLEVRVTPHGEDPNDATV